MQTEEKFKSITVDAEIDNYYDKNQYSSIASNPEAQA
jgi:hypothetical protein